LSAEEDPSFVVEQFRVPQNQLSVPPVGGKFTLREDDRVMDRALGLIQFVVSKCNHVASCQLPLIVVARLNICGATGTVLEP